MRRPFLSGEALVVTAFLVFLAILAWPMEAPATQQEGVTAPSTGQPNPIGGKRHQRGFFDGFQINGAPPTFWIYVDDDTTDGSGVAYYLYHSSYIEPGPANPNVDNNIQFNTNAQATSLNDAKAWIVNNHSHVNDVSELIVHQHDVSVP